MVLLALFHLLSLTLYLRHRLQAKYLGRQWRKSNMKTMSAIYQKVRHRLTDDWAFGNDVDSRPWDFQAQEFSLQASINRFHHRRYSAASGHQPQQSAAAQAQQQQNPQAATTANNSMIDVDGAAAAAEQDLLEEVDSNVLSVLTKDVELPKQFRDNYEHWLQREVFDNRIDWDQLLSATDSSGRL